MFRAEPANGRLGRRVTLLKTFSHA
nr:hypothetical protein [Aeromicrobium sp.]